MAGVECRGAELRERARTGGFRGGRMLVWIYKMELRVEGRSAGSLSLYGRWEFRREGLEGGCFVGSHGHV